MLLWTALALADDPVALTSDVGVDEITTSIRILSGADPVDGGPIVSRNVHHPDSLRAAAWLEAELTGMGLEVSEVSFHMDGVDPDPRDVVAVLPGLEPGPAVVLGAHYDSIASFDADWLDPAVDPAPGADDDGSGDAAILAIAARLAASTTGFRYPIRFVLFSGEEYGLLGSAAYVDGLAPGEVSAMIQLDSIGYAPSPDANLWVTSDEQSAPLSSSFLDFVPAAGVPVTNLDVPATLIDGDTRSDHYSFWQAGIPALHLASFPLPPTYHTMGDTIDVVDVAFTRDVTAEVGAFVAFLAEPLEHSPPPPAEADGGCHTTGSIPSIAGVLGGLCAIAPSLRGRSRRR